MDDSKGCHLSVILDLTPSQWHASAHAQPHPLALNVFLAQLLAFLNAHIAAKHENTLAVFAAFPGKRFISVLNPDPDAQVIDANSFPPFRLVDSAIVTRIMEEYDDLGEPSEEDVNRVTLPPASTANKRADGLDPAVLPDPRILILSVSPDLSTSYIPIMNAIFSAQKLASIFPLPTPPPSDQLSSSSKLPT
ncbi:hypothetical protein H0H87_005173 [Tephrocybe sp. NHM501043]|nr:hypothetical protein H0H87_005173 [Tephrocybe sp. NHM501043]